MTEVERYYDEDNDRTLLVVDEAKYSVMSHAQLERIREEKRRRSYIENAGAGRNYVVSYHGPIRKLNDILSLNELGAIMKLIPYMRFDTGGQLRIGKRRMGVEEIATVIGKARRWTITLINELVAVGILCGEKDGRRNVYNVSSEFHTIGDAVKDSPFTRVYQTKARADLANISIQAAGFLYKMIPYIHYEYLYLCCNPNARESDDIVHLSQNRFASEVGVDVATAARCMRELITAGFVMRSEAFGARIIRMNPDVMFRKRAKCEFDEYTEIVREEFRQAARAAEMGDTGAIEIDFDALPY